MSLLNTVLRDLAKRQADTSSKRPWQKEIRALPSQASKQNPGTNPWLVNLFIACIAGTLGYQLASWRISSQHEALKPNDTVPGISKSPRSDPASTAAVEIPQKIKPLEAPTQPVLRTPPKSTSINSPSAHPESLPRRNENPPIKKSELPPTPRAQAEASLSRAGTLLAQGQTDEAIAACYTALDHDPGFVTARQRLLNILERSGRRDEAAVVIADGLIQAPAQISWALWLSRHELKKGNLVKASEVLARSESYAKTNADYAGFQGHLAQRQGDGASASQHYRKALAISPQDGRWWFGLGEALTSTGDKANATLAYQRALSSGNLPPTLADLATQRSSQ